jgi:hypothetical protein
MRKLATSLLRLSLPSILVVFSLIMTVPGLAFSATGVPTRNSNQDMVLVKLSFDNGANGDLVPTSVVKDPVEQISMLGKPPGTVVAGIAIGHWATKQTKLPITVSGPLSCTLWADSQKGAKNAYFTVDLYKGTTLLKHYNTSRQTLGEDPVRYDISATLDIELAAGDTLSVSIFFFSDLVINAGTIIPQPAQATFLYGGGQYSSGISITTIPMIVTVQEPGVQDGVDFITFSAKVKEAFDADPSKMNFTFIITPPQGGNMKHMGKVNPQETSDGLTFSVVWNYTKDNAKDGFYTITMDVSYGGNTTPFTNTSKYYVYIPRKAVTGFENTPMQPLIIGSVALAVIFIGFAIYYNRKKIFKNRYAGSKASSKDKGPKAKPKREKDEEAED